MPLLAYYELRDNAKDITGKFGPMTLENAPFQDGGVYCNGIYKYSGKDKPCLMDTPNLSGLNFGSFSIGANFKTGIYRRMPVFVGGRSGRWIAFYLNSDGSVSLMYNNSNYQKCTAQYRLNTWHEAIVTYDGSTGRLYLDGKLGCSADFKPNQDNDKDISTTNFSNGEVFEGVLSSLWIYNGVVVP